jgi:hypothetical protein
MGLGSNPSAEQAVSQANLSDALVEISLIFSSFHQD